MCVSRSQVSGRRVSAWAIVRTASSRRPSLTLGIASIRDMTVTSSSRVTHYHCAGNGSIFLVTLEKAGSKPGAISDLDRKENELNAINRLETLETDGQATAEVTSADPSQRLPEASTVGPPAPTGTAPSKTDELYHQGDELYSMGLYEQAIHVWTRILFLDKSHPGAKRAIERATRAVSERQRVLDEELAVASRLIDRGDLVGASTKVRNVLSADPRNSEGHQLVERIAAKKRRVDVGGAPAVAEPAVNQELPAAKRGLLLRVSRSVTPRYSSGAGGSRLKMAAFALGTILVFATGALYLHLNWESIVSDGAFAVGAESIVGSDEPEPAFVPGPSELRYYNGARLFAKGRYREALSELALVEDGTPVAEKARGLILRIEEKLLRGAEEFQAPSDDSVEPR